MEDVFSVPYTSLMASSDDTSRPARMTVESEEFDDYFNVRYVWGQTPGDGEIAVSEELFNDYSYLIQGEVNEFYFAATKITYMPLKISGIYSCNDSKAGYVFVTKSTLNEIDRDIEAKVKYDVFLRFKNSSDRAIAQNLDIIMTDLRVPDTDYRKRCL